MYSQQYITIGFVWQLYLHPQMPSNMAKMMSIQLGFGAPRADKPKCWDGVLLMSSDVSWMIFGCFFCLNLIACLWMVLDRDKIWKLHQSDVRSRSTNPGACSPEFPPETRTHFGEAILVILCVGGFISINKVASTENLPGHRPGPGLTMIVLFHRGSKHEHMGIYVNATWYNW